MKTQPTKVTQTIQERLAQTRRRLSDRIAKWQVTIDAFPLLFQKLEDEEKLEPYFDTKDGCINLSFTADADKFHSVWRHLRIAGFKPGHHPKPKSTTFNTYWQVADDPDKKYAEIWMYFSSTSCKVVQVGTRMVEEAIYETQCSSELGELLASENDNPQVREG